MKLDTRLALAAVLGMAGVTAAYGQETARVVQDTVRVTQDRQGIAVRVHDMMGLLSVASRKDVQAELKTTNDQQNKIADLVRKNSHPMIVRSVSQADGPVTVTAGQSEVVAVGGVSGGHVVSDGPAVVSDRIDEQLASILTKPQQTRLSEIQIQLQGYMSLIRLDVQSELGMTDEQLATLKTVLGQPIAIRVVGTDGPPDPKEIKAQLDQQRQQRDSEIAAILNGRQLARLVSLGGKKFVPTLKEGEPVIKIDRVINP